MPSSRKPKQTDADNSPWYDWGMSYLFKSPITLVIIVLNALVFAGQMIGELSTEALALSPSTWEAHPETVLTSAFAHADIAHIGMNMLCLVSFAIGGWEARFGSLRFGLIYLGAILGGSAGVILLSSPESITVGASGGVFGIMGAMIAGSIRMRVPLGALFPFITLVTINFAIGFTGSGISWQGHLGGLVIGFLLAVLIGYKKTSDTPNEQSRTRNRLTE